MPAASGYFLRCPTLLGLLAAGFVVLGGSVAEAQASHSAPAGANCRYDFASMGRMSPRDFDRTSQGWRKVGQLPGCEAAGAALIAEYRRERAAELTDEERASLLWHEGQLRAVSGDYEAALPLLKTRLDSPSLQNRLYARATVAFLQRDRRTLLATRGEMANLPKPAEFEASSAAFKAKYGRPLTWPLNLDVVDGLIACFDRSYAEAYSCRPASSAQ